jgi:hypothetical protein
VAAEYAWIRLHLPGSHPAGQSLREHDGKPYDVIHLKLANGESRDVFFDISSFFGKL